MPFYKHISSKISPATEWRYRQYLSGYKTIQLQILLFLGIALLYLQCENDKTKNY